MLQVVEDTLVAGGLRRTRWEADAPIGFNPIEEEGWQVREWEDKVLGLHYVELLAQYRGPVEVYFHELGPWKFIRVLAWALQGERVSKCMREGAHAFASMVGRWPRYAYICRLPNGAEYGVEVDGVVLVDCTWVVDGYIFIGG